MTNWRNIVTRCKFLVVSLYNVNDAAHNMGQSIRFDCLKISRTEVSINLEVNWLSVCDLAHFFWRKQSKVRWNVCLTLIFYFKSKSKRNLVAKVVTKPEFLVAKEKMLVALATILPSVASKCVHVRKKHVVIGGKHEMFCHQTFEVWSRQLLCAWFVFAQKNIFCKNF